MFAFLKKIKRHNQILNIGDFDVDTWMFENRNTLLTDKDELSLKIRLDFEQIYNTLPKKSVLYYLIQKRRYENFQKKDNENKKQFIIRLFKTDFEKAFGISANEFFETYKDIKQNNPEMLI